MALLGMLYLAAIAAIHLTNAAAQPEMPDGRTCVRPKPNSREYVLRKGEAAPPNISTQFQSSSASLGDGGAPPDPFSVTVGPFVFTAANYGGPIAALHDAFYMLYQLSDDLIDDALDAGAWSHCVYILTDFDQVIGGFHLVLRNADAVISDSDLDFDAWRLLLKALRSANVPERVGG